MMECKIFRLWQITLLFVLTYFKLLEGFEHVSRISASSEISSLEEDERDLRTIDFNHERCQTETVSGDFSEISHYYSIDQFQSESGIIELLVRFKGTSDGHVILSEFANTSETDSAYVIILGSYENKVSEIRRGMIDPPVFKINTPQILSTIQFRGFLLRYNEKRGELWVYSEGSYMPLLHWKDPTPMKIRYFGFSAYIDKVVEVAFNCKAKDLHSLIFQHKPGQRNHNAKYLQQN